MANKYFIAGVGRALLFKGETLFADCRTLADSSITIGVTAEDIHQNEYRRIVICVIIYPLNCWNFLKQHILQHKNEICLNANVAKAEKNMLIAHGVNLNAI